MKRMMYSFAATVVLIGVSGCNTPAGSESATPDVPAANAQGEVAGEVADQDHSDNAEEHGTVMTDMEMMEAALANLSPEDATSARQQHVCPVSGDMLGVMGAPIKVDMNGQQVWICCENCREPLLQNPDEYLAKLNN